MGVLGYKSTGFTVQTSYLKKKNIATPKDKSV